MEKQEVCVFCGEKPGHFRSTEIFCGGTLQFACRSCEKELQDMDELEKCQRALVRGLAKEPERLRARIALITEAEEHRPKCLGCGGALFFGQVQELDNSPFRDSIFTDTFDVLPACCDGCGRIAFYDPGRAKRNKYLAYLIKKDQEE